MRVSGESRVRYGFGDVDMNDEERRRVLGVIETSSRRVIQRARDRRARLGPDEDGEGEEIVVLGFQLEVKPQFEVF